jgi:AcrR family transcriptional regulator
MRAALKPTPIETVHGKQRLIDAALRLGAREGITLNSIGLRELAREAELNHNTFYRHFSDIEELAQAAAQQAAQELMAGMKLVRQQSKRHADATLGAVKYFLDYVQRKPEAFILGLRELHGGAPSMRRLFRKLIDDIAQESVEQITTMNLAPGLGKDALLLATSSITYYMLYRSIEYIELPNDRKRIATELENFIRMQFLGAAAMS